MQFSYRKTIIKTDKILTEASVKYTFYYLKIFLRAIKFELIPILLMNLALQMKILIFIAGEPKILVYIQILTKLKNLIY